jgi:hypothetical protein
LTAARRAGPVFFEGRSICLAAICLPPIDLHQVSTVPCRGSIVLGGVITRWEWGRATGLSTKRKQKIIKSMNPGAHLRPLLLGGGVRGALFVRAWRTWRLPHLFCHCCRRGCLCRQFGNKVCNLC